MRVQVFTRYTVHESQQSEHRDRNRYLIFSKEKMGRAHRTDEIDRMRSIEGIGLDEIDRMDQIVINQ